jgi:uncharacterized protein
VPRPRVLADEMLGSLARYLRMMGCDTSYARGWTDEEILRRARSEGRVVVTRDRELARRAADSILLASPRLRDQVRAVRAAFPDLGGEVRFERCTACNGVVETVAATDVPRESEGVPWDRVARGLALFRCGACGHLYWEGTHTEDVRRRLREWAREGPA